MRIDCYIKNIYIKTGPKNENIFVCFCVTQFSSPRDRQFRGALSHSSSATAVHLFSRLTSSGPGCVTAFGSLTLTSACLANVTSTCSAQVFFFLFPFPSFLRLVLAFLPPYKIVLLPISSVFPVPPFCLPCKFFSAGFAFSCEFSLVQPRFLTFEAVFSLVFFSTLCLILWLIRFLDSESESNPESSESESFSRLRP